MKRIIYINTLTLLFCSICVINTFPQNGWEQMEDMLEASSWYGSCIDASGDKAYFFGGGNAEATFTATTQIYNFNSNTWEQGDNMPFPSNSLKAGMVDGKIYITGEHVQTSPPFPITRVKEYNPADDSWQILDSLPGVIIGYGSCVLNDLIYVFGGADENFNPRNTAWTYDPATGVWNELENIPVSISQPAVCVYNNEIFVFGEMKAFKYSPISNSWDELNSETYDIISLSVPIIHHDTIILLFGGAVWNDYYCPKDNIFAYYPETDCMVKLQRKMPFARNIWGYKHNNYVYFFGGDTACSFGSVTNEVWRFNLDSLIIPDCPVVSINEFLQSESKKLILKQNYPNPFSGSTVLSYQLLDPSQVSINIYDILGKKTTCLLDEYIGVGSFEIEWNAKGFSPGIYYAHLSNGNNQQTIKMIISK